MSCSNDMLYSMLNSSLARTSDDFYPDAPASAQALHIYTNAQIGLWFGEFIQPDWDMFQSNHLYGAFHAAARAVSGGPIYVSDRPEGHDFALLRKLVLPSGAILRAQLPGRPTRDCLFSDALREPVALKIFNRNLHTGVLGVFNCHGEENAPSVKAAVYPGDLPDIDGDDFAVYAHIGQSVRVLNRKDAWEVVLAPMAFEIFTVTAIQRGIAPLGMLEMFNSGGAILEAGFNRRGEYEFSTHTGGKVAVWCEQRPGKVFLDGRPCVYSYDDTSRLLVISVAAASKSAQICIVPEKAAVET
jgi:raffinose synthase